MQSKNQTLATQAQHKAKRKGKTKGKHWSKRARLNEGSDRAKHKQQEQAKQQANTTNSTKRNERQPQSATHKTKQEGTQLRKVRTTPGTQQANTVTKTHRITHSLHTQYFLACGSRPSRLTYSVQALTCYQCPSKESSIILAHHVSFALVVVWTRSSTLHCTCSRSSTHSNFPFHSLTVTTQYHPLHEEQDCLVAYRLWAQRHSWDQQYRGYACSPCIRRASFCSA